MDAGLRPRSVLPDPIHMERPLFNTIAPLRPFHREFTAHEVVNECRKVWRLIQRSPHWNEIRKSLTGLIRETSIPYPQIDLLANTLSATLPPNTDYEKLEELCRSLISWRTGPYQLGEFTVDTEWRSYMKWARVSPMIPQREGMRIADVGCSNGYFLYKLSSLNPEIAIGFDPVERCWLQFALLQSIFRVPHLAFLPMGLLALDAFPRFFDFILCMGVIYHQRDQALAVKKLYEATRPGGQVLLDSLVVPHDEPLIITPPDRYAKMRNTWTVPSAASLKALFINAGFKDVRVESFGALTTLEQRRTDLAPFESLAEFLDPQDHARTVEGHPAPHTAAVIGRK
jgi:tRNA (mo5U34)-methyltransferase